MPRLPTRLAAGPSPPTAGRGRLLLGRELALLLDLLRAASALALAFAAGPSALGPRRARGVPADLPPQRLNSTRNASIIIAVRELGGLLGHHAANSAYEGGGSDTAGRQHHQRPDTSTDTPQVSRGSRSAQRGRSSIWVDQERHKIATDVTEARHLDYYASCPRLRIKDDHRRPDSLTRRTAKRGILCCRRPIREDHDLIVLSTSSFGDLRSCPACKRRRSAQRSVRSSS